jgi:hypothetical protein
MDEFLAQKAKQETDKTDKRSRNGSLPKENSRERAYPQLTKLTKVPPVSKTRFDAINLTDKTDKTSRDSKSRLDALNVSIAIWEDGAMRIVTDIEAPEAIQDGATIYGPHEALMYVYLDEHSRKILHQFKRLFGGKVVPTDEM